jgi:hypothetical protein
MLIFWFASTALSAPIPAFVRGQLMDAKLTLIDGSNLIGTISEINEHGDVLLSGSPQIIAVSEIDSIVIDRAVSADSSGAGSVMVHLVNGSRIAIRKPALNDEVLTFESSFGIKQLPLQSISAIIWRATPTVETQLTQPSTSDDRIVVDTNEGERIVSGLIEGLDAQQLQFQYQNESRQVNIGRINGVLMADVGIKLPTGVEVSLDLIDLSKLRGVLVKLDDSQLYLKVLESLVLKVPTDQIKAIAIKSDRQVYLSDLTPVDVRQRTDFGLPRNWQRDRSVQGNRLTLRKDDSSQVQEFAKGLGVQAFTQLDFANDNAFTRFKAFVGIDTETKGRGDCRMVVRGDGIELWSARVRGTDSLQELDLDISGFKTISLIVLSGDAFDLADHANWCNARFVK